MKKIVYPEPICGEVKLSPRYYWECQMPDGHEGGHYMVRDPYIDRADAR